MILRQISRNELGWRGRQFSRSVSSTAISIRDIVHSKATIPAEGPITVNGVVRSVQRFKRVSFARVSDGGSLQPLQVVLSPELSKGLATGVAVTVSGKLEASPGAGQASELHATEVKIAGFHDAGSYPIQKKFHTAEFLRTIPHLRLRTSQNSLVLHARSQVIGAVTSFFAGRQFVQAHTPIITSSDCEGAGEVFTVTANKEARKASPADGPVPGSGSPTAEGRAGDEFFKTEKYLTVSSQLHLESYAQAVGNVWTLSPCFRAERSDTSRHLAEFYMLEAEMAFVDELEEVLQLVEGMLKAAVEPFLDTPLGDDLVALIENAQQAAEPRGAPDDQTGASSGSELRARWAGLATAERWPRIRYSDAIALLKEAEQSGEASFEVSPTYEGGLGVEHERFLADAVGRRAGAACPVFVTDYPRAQKPFYMAGSTGASGDGADTVACFDLLVPGVCELVGGSMREHRLEPLLARMRERGLDGDGTGAGSLAWYVDLRRFGSLPHGGFGLGFDRLVAYLTGTSSLRDVVSFPRWFGRCDG